MNQDFIIDDDNTEDLFSLLAEDNRVAPGVHQEEQCMFQAFIPLEEQIHWGEHSNRDAESNGPVRKLGLKASMKHSLCRLMSQKKKQMGNNYDEMEDSPEKKAEVIKPKRISCVSSLTGKAALDRRRALGKQAPGSMMKVPPIRNCFSLTRIEQESVSTDTASVSASSEEGLESGVNFFEAFPKKGEQNITSLSHSTTTAAGSPIDDEIMEKLSTPVSTHVHNKFACLPTKEESSCSSDGTFESSELRYDASASGSVSRSNSGPQSSFSSSWDRSTIPLSSNGVKVVTKPKMEQVQDDSSWHHSPHEMVAIDSDFVNDEYEKLSKSIRGSPIENKNSGSSLEIISMSTQNQSCDYEVNFMGSMKEIALSAGEEFRKYIEQNAREDSTSKGEAVTVTDFEAMARKKLSAIHTMVRSFELDVLPTMSSVSSVTSEESESSFCDSSFEDDNSLDPEMEEKVKEINQKFYSSLSSQQSSDTSKKSVGRRVSWWDATDGSI